MRHPLASAIAVAALSYAALAASSSQAPSIEAVLDRVGAYLEAYESALTALTADETFEQREIVQMLPARRGGNFESAPWFHTRARRTLESDVVFLRLPGNTEWAGFRSVQRVDGKAVAEAGRRLSELLASGADIEAQARAIIAASSKYNLGTPRTTNMPTVPLEVFHPRHRRQFSHRLDGAETVRGVKTVRVAFEETGSPTVIRHPEGGDVRSVGSAWAEPESGTLWRIEVVFRDPVAFLAVVTDVRVRVEFAFDRRLQAMVPVEMREVFHAENARGEGKATYKNFRRFETGARIVP